MAQDNNPASAEKTADANKKETVITPEVLAAANQRADDAEAKVVALTTQLEAVKEENTSLREELKKPVVVKEETEEEFKKSRGVFKLEDGRKFAFKFGTPKQLRYNGVAKSLEDLIKDKDAMEQLIYGKNAFVEQITK